VDDTDLQALWQAEAQKLLDPTPSEPIKQIAEQFMVLVTCRDEKVQTDLLRQSGRPWRDSIFALSYKSFHSKIHGDFSAISKKVS
jgi:hypothetical protein